MKKTVAIIGGGTSGLPALKWCLQEGLEATCFEKADNIGGIWHMSNKIKTEEATIYRSTFTNDAKIMIGYSDFPMPEDWPNFLGAKEMSEYYVMYAEEFKLLPHIQLQHEVISVERSEDFSQSGAWMLEVRDCKNGATQQRKFDFVMVCAGLFKFPKIPQYPGMEDFQGKIIHTQEYSSVEEFRNKKVLVVGFGSFALDVACELANVNPKTYVSTRDGNWVLPPTGPDGFPITMTFLCRSVNTWINWQNFNRVNNFIEGMVNEKLNHDLHQIRPKNRILQTECAVNGHLSTHLHSGRIVIKCNIKQILKNSVEFEDGSKLDDLDAIIFGTGYTTEFPFLKKAFEMWRNDSFNLYKWVFPPDVQPSTLAMVGASRTFGPTWCASELVARWAIRVFKGESRLPSRAAMREAIDKAHEHQRQFYMGNPRHHVTEMWLNYCDSIATEIGCKPNLLWLALTDWQLLWRVWCDPVVPAQYRLHGPNPWPGARDAVIHGMRGATIPMQTHRSGKI